ncbi:hypothetical protein F3Y22_tig00112343pilonHSYRG00127 [Hibiscus syriacus]|uniref:Uncharacterized protein n=1 Tax=Hibiscus syriacus TaxID=106335 RepID=A0A6A2X114_HIBSY|nr:hypothetical protein F3Y22_tig00112343pilonHSYRG00127 [Hibiscus syriacus]
MSPTRHGALLMANVPLTETPGPKSKLLGEHRKFTTRQERLSWPGDGHKLLLH